MSDTRRKETVKAGNSQSTMLILNRTGTDPLQLFSQHLLAQHQKIIDLTYNQIEVGRHDASTMTGLVTGNMQTTLEVVSTFYSILKANLPSGDSVDFTNYYQLCLRNISNAETKIQLLMDRAKTHKFDIFTLDVCYKNGFKSAFESVESAINHNILSNVATVRISDGIDNVLNSVGGHLQDYLNDFVHYLTITKQQLTKNAKNKVPADQSFHFHCQSKMREMLPNGGCSQEVSQQEFSAQPISLSVR